jgi:hypothetical protein
LQALLLRVLKSFFTVYKSTDPDAFEGAGTPPPRPQVLLYWYKSTDTDAADGAGSPPPRPQALLGAVVFEWGSIKALLRLC